MGYGERQLGDNVYDEGKYTFLKKYSGTYEPEAVYQSDVANLKNQADFYGQQADAHGANAQALEAKSAPAGSSAAGVGSAMAQGGTPADMASNGLLASGNPYAMAAGGVLKVASMGQQREQARMNAERAAFIDRNNKIREATDKILAMDFGI